MRRHGQCIPDKQTPQCIAQALPPVRFGIMVFRHIKSSPCKSRFDNLDNPW
jgi:hypothetical protein